MNIRLNSKELGSFKKNSYSKMEIYCGNNESKS